MFSNVLSWFTGASQQSADAAFVHDDEAVSKNNDAAAEELYALSQKLINDRRALKQRNASLKGRLRLAEQMLSERPAVWVPDEERSACLSCGDEFSAFNRRHHCRECGEIFDAKCSSNWKDLAAYPKMGPQRVCDDCFFGDSGNALDLEDLESSALIALGFGGTSSDESFVDTSLDQLREPPVKPKPRPAPVGVAQRSSSSVSVPCANCSKPSSAPTKAMPATSATGRVRSEIPPAPPFPTQLPKALSAPVASGAPAFLKNIRKKDKPAFVPPANAGKRIDYDELQKGISKLRKATTTPKKACEPKQDTISELRLSLRRRRRSLEDSVIVTASPKTSPTGEKNLGSHEDEEKYVDENENVSNSSNKTPLAGHQAKAVSSGLKTVALMDGLRETVVFRESLGPMNISMNSSWVE